MDKCNESMDENILRGHPGVQKHHRVPRKILAVKLCYVFHSHGHAIVQSSSNDSSLAEACFHY